MSRHRIVRTMNYEDEFYDDDEEYSRSVEDSYCISPSTAAQFTWNREKNLNFAAYMGEEDVINEEEEEGAEEEGSLSRHDSLSDSVTSARLHLSDVEQAQLNSCLEEARSILGESIPESVMATVIIQNHFNLETAVNQLLSQQDAPKPQREPRQRRNRSQDDIDNLELDNLLVEIQGLEASDPHVFSQEGLRITSAALCAAEKSEDNMTGGNLDVIANQLHDVSLSNKASNFNISDETSAVLDQDQSKHEPSEVFLSSKRADNQNQKEATHKGSFSDTSHTQQTDKISLADLAKQSAASKIIVDAMKHTQHIPSKLPSSSLPSASATEPASSPEQETAISLSDLVKQFHGDKTRGSLPASHGDSAPSAHAGREVKQSQIDKGRTVPHPHSVGDSSKVEHVELKDTSSSLAELARQHQIHGTTPGIAGTSPKQSFSFLSNTQRVQEGMASLSALVAQHSAQRKGSLETSNSGALSKPFGKISGTQSEITSRSLPFPSENTSSPKSSLSELAKAQTQADAGHVSSSSGSNPASKSSLSDLAKAHMLSERTSNVSLSQLAQQHRQSASSLPSSSTSPMSNKQNTGKPSMASLLKNLTLEESESKSQPVVSGNTTPSQLATSPPNTGVSAAAGLSLSSCLKTTKSLSKAEAGNTVKRPKKSKQEMPFPDDPILDLPVESLITTDPLYSWSPRSADATLLSDASSVGIVLCCVRRKRKLEDLTPTTVRRPLKYPKFMCLTQLSRKKLYAECVYHNIQPFNFSNPSPDDVVRNKQKQAFTRSDKEFVV